MVKAPEHVILVDPKNRVIGSGEKFDVHRKGLLHRAFSIFVIDSRGAVVLQKRHRDKYHSGGLWTNSCCGHPRPGEATLDGARRRLSEELGITARLKLAFRTAYAVRFGNGMAENELVNVYVGQFAGQLRPDPQEISDVSFSTLDELHSAVSRAPDLHTYWLVEYLRGNRKSLEVALAGAAMRR